MPGSGKESLIWLIPLLEIDEIVSAHPRTRSNTQQCSRTVPEPAGVYVSGKACWRLEFEDRALL
jgi:hypothetical protein